MLLDSAGYVGWLSWIKRIAGLGLHEVVPGSSGWVLSSGCSCWVGLGFCPGFLMVSEVLLRGRWFDGILVGLLLPGGAVVLSGVQCLGGVFLFNSVGWIAFLGLAGVLAIPVWVRLLCVRTFIPSVGLKSCLSGIAGTLWTQRPRRGQ